jgi:carbohydrate-selective porin OprB
MLAVGYFWLVASLVSGFDLAVHGAEPACDDLENELGEWQGLRHEEPARLLTFEPVYYGEVFTNARGGKTTKGATRYLGLLDLGIRFDLDETRTGIPGHVYFLVENTHGRGLTQDFVGDTQVISNIDSLGNVTQRLGRQDMNADFQRIDSAEHFVQSTFGLSPSTAFPTYPDQAAGAVIIAKLTADWQWKAGLWNAFVQNRDWGFSDNHSFLAVTELEYRYTSADGGLLGAGFLGVGLPGVFSIGALYESEGELEGELVSPVREYYVQWEQTLYRPAFSDHAQDQGLAAFVGYYPRFPGGQPIAQSIGDSAVAGLTYTGLLPGREADVIGVGVAWSELFQGGTNRETATELFYRAVWSSRLSFQPDMQYIASPSGIYRDALVAGIRMEVSF